MMARARHGLRQEQAGHVGEAAGQNARQYEPTHPDEGVVMKNWVGGISGKKT
jgi:hypothetical protein